MTSLTACRAGRLLGLALALALATTTARGAAAQLEVDFADDRLTLRAEQAPLRAALVAVAGAAGLEVQLRGELSETVSRSIRDLPLHSALARLLEAGGHSFILKLAPEGSGKAGRLLVTAANGRSAPVVSLAAAADRSAATADPEGEAFEEAVELLEAMSLEQDARLSEAAAEALAELEDFTAAE